MMCDDARLLLHAYLDNELDAAQSVAIERHMQDCPACAARYAGYAQLRRGFTQASLYRRAPEALRAQWSADQSTRSSAMPFMRGRRSPIALALAAGIAAAVIVAAPAWFYGMRRVDIAAVDEVVSSHVRSMQPQHLMDVVSTDQHTVKPWFAGRLDFSPRVKDLASEGFPLVGGRLDALDGHSVAALIYRRRLHVINLYQWPVSSTAADLQVTRQRGYTVVRWTSDHMRYVAVSDVSEQELQQFAQAFKSDAGLR